jgi:hypothetical protein
MAKARGKKITTHKAQPGTNDAQRFAAIRWLAMKIEQISIEVLVTDRGRFEAVERSLKDEVNRLKQLSMPKPIGGDDCPEGYVLCHDGLCAPMCDGFTTIEASAARKPGKKK